MRTLLTSLALLCCTALFSEETIKLTAAPYTQSGVMYMLPSTCFVVELEVMHTVKRAGIFYNYAEKYLGDASPIQTNNESWEITAINAYTQGIPDKSQQYVVEFGGGSKPILYLNKEGVLLSINRPPAVDTIAATPLTPTLDCSLEIDPTRLSGIFDEEMLHSGSVAKMADIAAKQLYRLRESRLSILTGEAENMPADGVAHIEVMQQIDRREAELTALFTGTITKQQRVQQFLFTPIDSDTSVIICRFSHHFGVVPTDDLSGAPVTLSYQITDIPTPPIDAKGKPRILPRGGLIYRIPGYAQLSIAYQGRSLFAHPFQVAQAGILFGIPANTFSNTKHPVRLLLFPQSGAIREIGE